MLHDIEDVFQRGESHTYHHRVDDAVKGFVEFRFRESIFFHHQIFAPFFRESYDQKGFQRGEQDAFRTIVSRERQGDRFYHTCQQGTHHAEEETDDHVPSGLAVIFILEEKIEADGDAGGDG